VVALLVIGPEKLPKVARTVGAFTGRMQRYMSQIKEEVNREMRFEELQKLQQEIKQSVENTQSSINQQVADIQNEVTNIADSPKPSRPKRTKPASKLAPKPSE
jgi:sec-independent protein translocase protein TatB